MSSIVAIHQVSSLIGELKLVPFYRARLARLQLVVPSLWKQGNEAKSRNSKCKSILDTETANGDIEAGPRLVASVCKGTAVLPDST